MRRVRLIIAASLAVAALVACEAEEVTDNNDSQVADSQSTGDVNPGDGSAADAVSDGTTATPDATATADATAAPDATATPDISSPPDATGQADGSPADATSTPDLTASPDMVADVAPDMTGSACPTEPPIGESCSGLAHCEWGQECCGGQCDASLVCDCSGGSWACYNTDFCFGFMGPGAGECRDGNDCSNMDQCFGPDDANCGICQDPPVCASDSDCLAGNVCSATMGPDCACNPGQLSCVPACASDSDCDSGLACDQGHCNPIACAADSDCPDLYGCGQNGECARITCAADSDCPRSSPCVKGACHPTYGACSPIAP